jgi:hypothetical protein
MESGIVKAVVGFFSSPKRLGPNQPPIQRVLAVRPPRVKRPGREVTTNFRLAPRLRMNGAILLLLLYTFKAHSNLPPSTNENNFRHTCPKEAVQSEYASVYIYTNTHDARIAGHKSFDSIYVIHKTTCLQNGWLLKEQATKENNIVFLCTVESTTFLSLKTMRVLYIPPGILPTQCIYVFYINLRTNNNYFPTQK